MRKNNFKVQASAAKVGASVLWDSGGILLVEFSERRAATDSKFSAEWEDESGCMPVA
jgi:hypothetical protein